MPPRPFADRDEQRDKPAREKQPAKPVNAARLAYGRFRDEHDRSDGGYRGDDEQDPEEPVVGEVLKDRAGHHDPEPAADSEECRDEGDRAGDALARKLIANDPERERIDRCAETLDGSANDQQRQRRSDGRDQ